MRWSPRLCVPVLVVLACLVGQALPATRELGFAERVLAQEAIERVRYAHQIDARRSFAEAVPRTVLEDEVRTYLAQSALLESVWNTPVTAEMLELELLRMTSRTRLPDRLDELFAALDHDPFLILECLVRPKLVDRLSRKLFTDDAQMHSAALDEARRVRGELSRGDLDPTQPHPARRAVELTRRTDDARVAEIAVPNPLELDSDAFDRWRELAPKAKGAIGPLMGERDAFTIRIVLDEDPDRARIATYAFAKRSWDDWWLDSSASADTDAVRAVADGSLPLPPVTGDGAPACAGAGWSSGVLEDMPDRRVGHVAVWTGNEMIVWGGSRLSWWTNTGMRYDPSTDSWTATSLVGAPSARAGHAGVWTGSELIVWGAAAGVPGGISFDDTGGRYDPLTDSWSPTSLTGVPVPRSDPTAVWTGDVAIFWGGYFLGEDVPPCNCCDGGNGQGCDNATCESIVCGQDSFCCNVQWDVLCDDLATSVCTCCEGSGSGPVKTGGRYDPDTDSWTSTSLLGAPTGRSSHTAVWTGAEMIVWGGFSGPSVNTGGRYDPFLDTWFATSMAGVPIARTSHVAVWTGNEMIVWGGAGGGSAQNTGGRYLPNSNSWLPVTLSGAPQGRSSHTAVWDGDEMIVWGGNQVSEVGNTGGRYNPSTNSWTPTATTGAPNGRYGHSMIWTGSEVIVWGGSPNWANGFYELLDTGGRYDPGTDSWAPTFASDAPQNRSAHTAVWTGNEMIIWGGGITNTKTLQVSPTGGLYDPATDSWSPTRLSGAPDARIAHTAVWTGDEMIVWGGYTDFDTTSTGGRYDPITNQWTPTSITGAQERSGHSAVWTGGEMFVWGGSNQNTGDRYDPLADDWTPISVVDAPTARSEHTAVWTGGKMIVWGGYGGGPQNTGGIYHPLSDFWTPTTTVGAPQERSEHSAVWTGEEMIVWGGAWPGATGGRYNPIADQWSEVTTDGAPADYYWHTSVWTGNRMIVWGGGFGEGQTGGYYDPLSDSWEPTVTTGAPDGRSRHSAVWTGEAMIVWGGNGQGGTFADGGIYDPDGEDLDGDGYGCELDCDDDDASVFGAPVEIVDVRFRSSTVLRWPSANPSTGESTVYDVVRGVASELPVGGGISETCLAPGYDPPGVGDQVQLQDTDQPSTGETFWYLIRATNPCGIGSYGATSQAVERQTSICP